MFLSNLLVLTIICVVRGDDRFECGAHGRFEYCIDGFPGCVVGCHCYPGYYFDTETKICEANTKLLRDYKFRSDPNPQHPLKESPRTENYETTYAQPSTTEDISDWLYNQLFKTLENQVVSNTGSNITRRANTGNKKTRRKRKGKRKKGSRKKRKHKNLRRELLRLTADDSAFNSPEDEDKSGTSSSDSDSDSSSDDSDSSTDSDGDSTQSDHDHRKLLVINKKPKPPLPSFIFLPQMDTPYYPPLSLPMPPPMFPMPPPPMMPPIVIHVPSPAAPTVVTPAPAVITTSAATTSSPSAQTTAHPPETTATADVTVTEVVTKPARLRSGLSNRNIQKNIMDQLRQRHKKIKSQPARKYSRKPKNPDISPFSEHLNNDELDDSLETNTFIPDVVDNFYPKSPSHDQVSFSSLTDLIHRDAANDKQPFNPRLYNKVKMSRNRPSPSNYGTSLMNDDKPPELSQILNNYESSTAHQPDRFYSDLGREIATLIRKIDSHGDRQIDIEIDQIRNNNAVQPMLNVNSYSSKSYWERSVRSPYISKGEIYKLGKSNQYANSKEKLFDLENKVFMAATKANPGLVELENIVNLMGKAKMISNVQNSMNKQQHSNNSYNVNLLPRARAGARSPVFNNTTRLIPTNKQIRDQITTLLRLHNPIRFRTSEHNYDDKRKDSLLQRLEPRERVGHKNYQLNNDLNSTSVNVLKYGTKFIRTIPVHGVTRYIKKESYNKRRLESTLPPNSPYHFVSSVQRYDAPKYQRFKNQHKLNNQQKFGKSSLFAMYPNTNKRFVKYKTNQKSYFQNNSPQHRFFT